jgi:t-SNARE complex subunit (syntaxin)
LRYVITEEQLSENTQINIIDDLTDMRNKVQRFFNLLTDFSSQFGNQLSTAIKNSLSDFQNSTTSFIAQLHSAINGEQLFFCGNEDIHLTACGNTPISEDRNIPE